MALDHFSDQPLYEQLAGLLRAKITSGEIGPRQPLPSNHQLVGEYGVARGTAAKAVAVLVAEGLARVVPGKGVYVLPKAERGR